MSFIFWFIYYTWINFVINITHMFCVFKHGFGHAIICSDWLCPSTFFFARHLRDILGSLFPGTRDVARVFRVAGECKVRNLIWWTGHCVIYLRCHSCRRHLDVYGCNPILWVSVVLVSRKVNLLVIFWLIRSLADNTYTVRSIIVCGPVQILPFTSRSPRPIGFYWM